MMDKNKSSLSFRDIESSSSHQHQSKLTVCPLVLTRYSVNIWKWNTSIIARSRTHLYRSWRQTNWVFPRLSQRLSARFIFTNMSRFVLLFVTGESIWSFAYFEKFSTRSSSDVFHSFRSHERRALILFSLFIPFIFVSMTSSRRRGLKSKNEIPIEIHSGNHLSALLRSEPRGEKIKTQVVLPLAQYRRLGDILVVGNADSSQFLLWRFPTAVVLTCRGFGGPTLLYRR